MHHRGPRLALAALTVTVCAVLPAGCLEGLVPTTHTMDVNLNMNVIPDDSDARWSILLPVLFTDGNPRVLAPLYGHLQSGEDSTIEVVERAEYWRVARAAGRDSGNFVAAITTTAPELGNTEEFVNYEWTTQAPPDPQNATPEREHRVLVFPLNQGAGNISLQVQVIFSAQSNWCSRDAHFNGTVVARPAAEATWQALEGWDWGSCA
jgi:hypothetical protein